MEALKGTGVALVTPFIEDGSIDFTALERIVHYTIERGVNYLVVLGTTGEGATLSSSEKQEVIQTVIRANESRVPLVLGVGGNSTAQVVKDLQTADLSAFTAVLSVSPYYNKPSQEGIYRHFKAVAQASSKPIILYNVPGRTSSNMLPETVKRLAQDFANIVAIKEAKGDIVQAMELLRILPKDFLVISGEDMITLPMVLAGGAGVISVTGQALPQEFTAMVNLASEGKPEQAYSIQYQLMPIIDLIFEEGNPTGIKAVFEYLGLCQAQVRLPLVKASSELKKKVANFMSSL